MKHDDYIKSLPEERQRKIKRRAEKLTRDYKVTVRERLERDPEFEKRIRKGNRSRRSEET